MIEDIEMEGHNNAVQDLGTEANPFAPAGENENDQKPKRGGGGTRSFTDTDLCEKGLNTLFTELVANRDKLALKGRGHELKDFAKLMGAYRKWHMEFAPKL